MLVIIFYVCTPTFCQTALAFCLYYIHVNECRSLINYPCFRAIPSSVKRALHIALFTTCVLHACMQSLQTHLFAIIHAIAALLNEKGVDIL